MKVRGDDLEDGVYRKGRGPGPVGSITSNIQIRFSSELVHQVLGPLLYCTFPSRHIRAFSTRAGGESHFSTATVTISRSPAGQTRRIRDPPAAFTTALYSGASTAARFHSWVPIHSSLAHV